MLQNISIQHIVTESQPSQTNYHPLSPDQHAPPSRSPSLEF